MNISEIFNYAVQHPCKTLFITFSPDEAYKFIFSLEGERRYSNYGDFPEFDKLITIRFRPRGKQDIYLKIDSSITGVSFYEFNTITPDDYVNFKG